MLNKPLALVFFLMLFSPYSVSAEKITYKLYLSMGFLNIQAGESSLFEFQTEYGEGFAIMSRMIMATNRRADRIFFLRDTMTSYSSLAGHPFLYTKTVNEGQKSDVEIAELDNSEDYCAVILRTYSNGVLTGSSSVYRDSDVHDMLSMLRYTRKMSSKDIAPGYTVKIPMVNGLQVVDQHIVYEGMESVKAANNKEYNCLALSVRDYKYGKERVTLRVLVTSDSLHIPVQLDLNLGVGKIKALLSEYCQ